MATLSPNQLTCVREDSGMFREIEVLQQLCDSLPDDYEVFHEVVIQTIHKGDERHGEIDIVILAPNGNVLLMEVKAGKAIVRNGGIFKRYGNNERDITRQCRIQYGSMVNRLKDAGIHPYLSNCLAMPDYHIPAEQIVSIARQRIIGADEYPNIGEIVQVLINAKKGRADVNVVRRFLRNEFKVSPTIATLQTQLENTTETLSDGLALWVPRIEHSAKRFRVVATAGSGKTQLALRLLSIAADRQQTALYVCYNRHLSDMIDSSFDPLNKIDNSVNANPQQTIASFHELIMAHYHKNYQEPDFNDKDVFKKAEDAWIKDAAKFTPKYDWLLIDEGQDFNHQWINSLLNLVNPDGHLYLMEDDSQSIYPRETGQELDIGEAVTINCNDNFRSPRAICQVINALGLVTPPIISKSPYQGEIPEFYKYDNGQTLISQTEKAINQLIAQGFAISDIVVLTGAGHNRSKILQLDKLGKYSTCKFTGDFNKGEPVWSKGELKFESLYRFKGQCASAIVLTEIEFTELTPLEKRKLFVGFTRAQMSVQVVIHNNSIKLIEDNV